MKNFWQVLIFFSALVACGKADTPDDAVPNTPSIERLAELTANARVWAPTCSKVDGLTYPAFDPNGDVVDCGDGDGVYLNGSLCLVGETSACDMVRASVDSDGRLWRSPFRLQNGDNGVNTASRDQLNGLLLYLVATKDKATAKRFQGYIEKTNGRLCPYDTDNRCNLTAVSYGLLAKVWSYIGLTPPIPWSLQTSVLTNTLKIEAATVSPGYQMFLVGQQILILIRTGDYSLIAEGAANSLFERQSDNPFYRYLVKGADIGAIELAISQAQTAKPTVANQFYVSRHTAEKAWLNSSGWDTIFLYQLFVGGGK